MFTTAMIQQSGLMRNPDFNVIIRSVTTDEAHAKYYHWYIVVIPRIFRIAGFQLASGIAWNSHFPENDALRLREQDID